jgi:hypothetical protein
MNPSRQAQANLELILNQVKVLCKGVRFPKKRKSRRGRKPKYHNWYILQLVVIQNLLGFTSERSYLRFLEQLKLPSFRELSDHSIYNRRVKSLKPLIDKLTEKLLLELGVEKSKVRILDATPVPVIRLSRAKNRKILTDKRQISIGYCSSQKTYYCGAKLSLLVNKDGIPTKHYLKPANHSDIRCLEEFAVQSGLNNLVLVADKGYISNHIKGWLRETRLVKLITSYRNNQKKKNTKSEKKLLRKRRIIETVIGQLKDQMSLDKLRVRTYESLETKVNNIIFTYIFGVYFNKITGRNPLNLKNIIT